jgi:hypothetical protein
MEGLVSNIRNDVKIEISEKTKFTYTQMLDASFQKTDCENVPKLLMSFDKHSKWFYSCTSWLHYSRVHIWARATFWSHLGCLVH